MTQPTQANPALGPVLPGYDPSGHQTNVAIQVSNVQTDGTTGVVYGQLVSGGGGGAVTDLSASGTITASGQRIQLQLGTGQATWEMQFTGTFAGSTLVFEGSDDASSPTNWKAAVGQDTSLTSPSNITSYTGNGTTPVIISGKASGYEFISVRCSSFTGGDNISVRIIGSVGSSGASSAGGGGGGGAITAAASSYSAGALVDGADVAQGTTTQTKATDGSITSWSVIQLLKGIFDKLLNSIAVTVASLPLPSGASTAAKQPALGTAGTPATDVISVQGVSNGTVVPISGTVNTLHGSSVDSANSSTTVLTANSAFTGTSQSSLNYSAISLEVYSDQASAAGGLSVQQSTDGTNWDIKDTFTISAATAFQTTVNLIGQNYRVLYTNGSTNQATFRLQTVRQTQDVVLPRTLTALGNLKMSVQESITIPVSGTFWQTTQPVSAASGQFVDGADATQGAKGDTAVIDPTASGSLIALLKGLLTELIDIEAQTTTTPVVSGTVTANQGGTWTVQPGNTANTTAWKVDNSAVTQPTSAASGQFVDGSIATIGAKADTAITDSTTTNSLQSFVKGFVKILADVWDSTNHLLASNVKQVGGTTVDTNSGNKGGGTQRVVLATDQPALTNAQPENLTQVGGNSIATGNNAVPVLNSASAGAVAAYGSNAAATTGGSDYAFKWGASGTTQVNHVMLSNNTGANVSWDDSAATTAGSDILATGQKLFLDVQTAAFHVQTSSNQNVNGSSANNLVIKGWL